ncbi:MAG: hypothetical protein ABIV04_19015, partial [Massilia sp.]
MSNSSAKSVQKAVAVRVAAGIPARTLGQAADGAAARAKMPQSGRKAKSAIDVTRVHHVDPQTRIKLIREGVPASTIGELSARMGMSKEYLLSSLGLSR